MTVRELKKHLEPIPDDLEVWVSVRHKFGGARFGLADTFELDYHVRDVLGQEYLNPPLMRVAIMCVENPQELYES